MPTLSPFSCGGATQLVVRFHELMGSMLHGGRLLQTRTYGTSGPVIFVLHGGPAAVGEAAPIARGLATCFRAVEPFQRGSGDTPLTVTQHVEDLHELIQSMPCRQRPGIVGESWGAMLALAYLAAHPSTIAALVLVGCGTFDKVSRAQMNRTIRERSEALCTSAERRQAARDVYDYDPEPDDEAVDPPQSFDAKAHAETWNSMLEAQKKGIYPSAFSSIKVPVLMIHGAYDPHPGRMIYKVLSKCMPQIEYNELSNCGHSPWKERQAREQFFRTMSAWLKARLREARET